MQKLKTRVIKKDVNPEWNEDLTLSVTDPNLPIMLVKCFVHYLSKKKKKVFCSLPFV
jgi:Ca2+-dependent lipid-binding protein